MGFNPAYWLAISIAFSGRLMSVTVCYWGAALAFVVLVLDVLRRWMELEFQAPIRRREQPAAVREIEPADGIIEYRIRVAAQGFQYSQIGSELMSGRLIKGKIVIESK